MTENDESTTLTDSHSGCPAEASQADVDAAIEELETDGDDSDDLIVGS